MNALERLRSLRAARSQRAVYSENISDHGATKPTEPAKARDDGGSVSFVGSLSGCISENRGAAAAAGPGSEFSANTRDIEQTKLTKPGSVSFVAPRSGGFSKNDAQAQRWRDLFEERAAIESMTVA